MISVWIVLCIGFLSSNYLCLTDFHSLTLQGLLFVIKPVVMEKKEHAKKSIVAKGLFKLSSC